MSKSVSGGDEKASLEHILKLLKDEKIPALDGDLAEVPCLREIHEELKSSREFIHSFLAGDASREIEGSGIIPDFLKILRGFYMEFLEHFRRVEKGDFSHEIKSPGRFSETLNCMTSKLDLTFRNLIERERALLSMAESLQNELSIKNSTLDALRKSESRFRYLASHDILTGAMNRRSFIGQAIVELGNAALLNLPCCVIMMDIDHFKIFNDNYGHPAGDEALRQTVKTLTSILRKNDFLGRYGGEEFVFLCSGADMPTGALIAERMREAMERTPIKLESGEVKITGSFGLAENTALPEIIGMSGEGYIEILIKNADEALYQAKREGRNRVVCYTGKGPDE